MTSNLESSKNQIKLIESITGPTTKTRTNSQIINQNQIDDQKLKTVVYKVFNINNEDNISQNSFLSNKTFRADEKKEINIIPQNQEYNLDEILDEAEEEEVEEGENNLNQNIEIINNTNIENINIISINNIEIEKIREDNLRKEVLKVPFNIIKKYLEKIGKIKLQVNLDDVFGTCICQNRAALDLRIYIILNFNKENKFILKGANPEPEKTYIFFYFLTRKFKFIFQKYIDNDNQFEIKGDNITIEEFKTLNDILEEKREKLKNYNNEITKDKKSKIYNKTISEEKIKKFEEISKGFLRNIENGFFDERKKKKKSKKEKLFFIIRTIDKLEKFVREEEQ